MTGPEHYKEAERLLRAAETARTEHVGEIQQAAQVHATLALAAATVWPNDALWPAAFKGEQS